jgi:small GTP-binding protein
MDDDDTLGSQGDDNYDEKIKIMIIGESKIGKTSLISRYCNNKFIGGAYLSTIGIDFQIKNLVINKKNIRLQIWDTAGQERYRNIAKNYFQSSDGFIIVYDISDIESFEKLDYWIEQIKTNSQENIKMILFGNKCDLIDDRQIKKEEGEEYAKTKKIKFFEVSAKDGTNVNEAFEYFVNDILNSFSQTENYKKRKSKMLSVPIELPKKKSSCC